MPENRNNFLRRLTAITVAVLAGIVALQVYWLVTSYRQQQSRFTADIQNALAAANVKTTIRKAIGEEPGLLQAFDLSGLSNQIDKASIHQPLTGSENANEPIIIKLQDPSFKVEDTQRVAELFRKALDTNRGAMLKNSLVKSVAFEVGDSDLNDYKAAYKKELEARAIFIPFELAIADEKGKTYTSTIDSNAFKKIPVKSSIESLSNTAEKAGLQAAFPNANIYLLKQMAWTLVVTILLLLAGIFSLGYLLRTFFKQRRLAELRTDFMNNMTHELKTPISSVSVALEMVLNKQLALSEEKKTSYLFSAQKELNRLKFLVENVLQILSLERSQIELHTESFQLLPFLQEIQQQLAPVLSRNNAELQITASPEHLILEADRTHLHSVLQNLIENALKYNNKPSPLIRVSAHQDELQTCLSVKDNGSGIPAKYLDKVFDKFFRVPKGDRHDVRGYGLGLSYVKTIVEMHGGSVTASSIEGEGSEFSISLPHPKTA